MDLRDSRLGSDAHRRQADAVAMLARFFQQAGWRVARGPSAEHGHRPDLLIRRLGASYSVQVKAGAEGRSDRLIPLWSQAYIQASRMAGKHEPLAVVAAPKIAQRAAEQVIKFVEKYVPDAAAGVIDFEGLRVFRGPQLEAMNVEPPRLSFWNRVPVKQAHLFSDLNQWMLKVLIAPELPEKLLSAPRARYRRVSDLSRAAGVSVMSASRFVQQLRREGYLHESDPHLKLVRREDLFRRWQASAMGNVKEVPMRLLLRSGGSPAVRRRILDSTQACLALFAAARALGVGFVEGVPDHVYVRRLVPADLAGWKGIVLAEPGEAPDVIVRRAPAANSVFRGMVRPSGIGCCDILQVWLDVSSHPSRGQEQADLIRQRILGPLLDDSS